MKIPANTVEELPIGTLFRHEWTEEDRKAAFVVTGKIYCKCIYSKIGYLKKNESYRIAFNDDIYILDENEKIELL